MVSGIDNTRTAFSHMNGYVGNRAVLCKMCANGRGIGISVFNTNIYVHHWTVESPCIGIAYTASRTVAAADKPKKVFPFCSFPGNFLKTGCLLGKDKNRAFAAITNDTNTWGDVNRLAEFIHSFGDKEDTATIFFLFGSVQCFLQSIGNIHTPVSFHIKILGSEIYSCLIHRSVGKDRPGILSRYSYWEDNHEKKSQCFYSVHVV